MKILPRIVTAMWQLVGMKGNLAGSLQKSPRAFTSQSVAPGPAALVITKDLLEIEILGPHATYGIRT